ncbi:MAG: hypothetical protein JO284_09920 [Planctomycetaceae bacterium]|nr:hypothetical protein [Planctomycetaceae bacterium]MBV8555591.1 hypothetical protein [Planctomycetaceae bacterium]
MAGAEIPEPPGVPVPPTARGGRHTRWFLITLYMLAFVWGARSIYFWEPTSLDLLFRVALAILLGWWAVADARWRRHPIPLLSRSWFVLGATVLVPVYVIWSRRWRGVGWIILHTALWFVLATVVMTIGGLIVFGGKWPPPGKS